ncbi:MAG: family 78 glycoside hydrolase catalytic domain [Victivallales bacterium]|nr:family 78 glycoside hydrolase catalytic domain [Victivallales bacterium]
MPDCIQIEGKQLAQLVFVSNGLPHISWRTPVDFMQFAWQIVARNESGALVWDSGKVEGKESRWHEWGALPLKPRQCVEVAVRVFDKDGKVSDYSVPVKIERTLEGNEAWENAQWIWFDKAVYSQTPPSPYFRKEFHLRGTVAKARLYITARGVFECYVNGQKASSDLLQPGWVDFKQRIPFLTYDVTSLLQEGGNAVGVVLADGWCCGNLTIFRRRNVYHPHPELLLRLEMTYEDGTGESIVSDGSWRVSTGPVLSSDLYDGEEYDARLEMPGWNAPGFDDAEWEAAAVSSSAQDCVPLVAKDAPAVRYGEELRPVAMLQPRKGLFIWDFGQNFTGVFRVRFRSQKGRLIRFRTAEMLDEKQMLYTDNYRSAKSEDSYICDGDGKDYVEYTPSFTFHGFRYLEISGFQLDGVPAEEIQVTGLPMYSMMPQGSCFSTGLPMLDRLWQNAVWGQRSNFLELPTDCPQRDERLGWTGDAQVFAPTAMLNMDCLEFFRKYLLDVREAMTPDGAAPSIAPAILRMQDGTAGWGDAIVTIPWNLYCHYGVLDVIAENYEAMKRSNAYQIRNTEDFIIKRKQIGDWLALEETPSELVACAYLAHTTRIISKCAALLGKCDEAKKYAALTEEICGVFRARFVDAETGKVLPQTQCAVAMALEYNLLLPEQVDINGKALNDVVRNNGTRISTGFLGTPIILQALCHAGFAETACDLLLQEEYPSWLYLVKQGATTFWERWNGYSREHGFGDVSMNSFNHYAYGTVAQFMMEEIGGIHYRHKSLVLKIIPDRRFSPVRASFDSPYGMIISEWSIEGRTLTWKVSAPLALRAKVSLPDGLEETLDTVSRTYHVKL